MCYEHYTRPAAQVTPEPAVEDVTPAPVAEVTPVIEDEAPEVHVDELVLVN